MTRGSLKRTCAGFRPSPPSVGPPAGSPDARGPDRPPLRLRPRWKVPGRIRSPPGTRSFHLRRPGATRWWSVRQEDDLSRGQVDSAVRQGKGQGDKPAAWIECRGRRGIEGRTCRPGTVHIPAIDPRPVLGWFLGQLLHPELVRHQPGIAGNRQGLAEVPRVGFTKGLLSQAQIPVHDRRDAGLGVERPNDRGEREGAHQKGSFQEL